MTEAERLFHANLEWAAALARNVARHLPPSFDAGDLIQEAHIELWKRAQLYDPSRNDSFQGFAYLPIRGACLMACRRRSYRDATHDEIDPVMASQRPEGDELILADIQASQSQRKYDAQLIEAMKLIALLPAAEAYLVRRIYIEGAELAEMATSWRVSKATIARRLAGAVRRMKKGAACLS